jgi:hypothetical protein
MATLRENSALCLSSQLDIFSVSGTQSSQEKNTLVPHYPISSLDDGPIEFDIKPSPQYTDLADTRLYIKAKITGVGGAALAPDDRPAPVNMLLHALFSKVDVYVGERLMTQSTGTYPWKAAIETVLNFGTDAKTSHLQTTMYRKDSSGQMNSTDPTAALGGNAGLKARYKLTSGSKSFELYGPLHVDFFFQPKYLIGNVPIRVRLTRSSPEFCLMSNKNTTYKMDVQDAVLWVRRVHISPTVELAHAKVMQTANAVYPMHRIEMEQVRVRCVRARCSIVLRAACCVLVLLLQVPIPLGTRAITKDNFFGGKLPRRLVIALLSNEAANGSLTQNPFNFQHFGLETLDLSVDGEPVAGTPLRCDFTSGLYARAYDSMFHFLNKSYKDHGLDISYEDFGNGYSLFCFDLTADGCGNCTDHLELERSGNLRLQLSFANNLTSTVNLLMYGEFESSAEVTRQREVLVDYRA